ncbi:hypothetical protein NLU13_5024 [Sarocladium strictum]|uniref:Uncharacterized protein n=1 Tax=Sarocladium strictum TaxID=5046 RepID=A0AA39GKN4_SARSR|nr:hypothetical protein NLU13_5024 [Sarocladium strictum]
MLYFGGYAASPMNHFWKRKSVYHFSDTLNANEAHPSSHGPHRHPTIHFDLGLHLLHRSSNFSCSIGSELILQASGSMSSRSACQHRARVSSTMGGNSVPHCLHCGTIHCGWHIF